jgi:hypothetical protein
VRKEKKLHRPELLGQGLLCDNGRIGWDEETVRDYIRKQEDEDKKLDQLKMFDE